MSEQSAYMGWKLDFTEPHGEPAFVAPDSVTWRISKNPVTGAIGGICAVLLKFAEPHRTHSGQSHGQACRHHSKLKKPGSTIL